MCQGANSCVSGACSYASMPHDAGAVGIKASTLVGATVKNAKGESIGEIHEVMVGSDGMVQGPVIDVSGFLGMNEKPVLGKWSDVTIQSDTNGSVVVAT